jgi:hypothetical protein
VPKKNLFCCWSLGYHKLWKCQSTLIKSKIKHLFKVTTTMHIGNLFCFEFWFCILSSLSPSNLHLLFENLGCTSYWSPQANKTLYKLAMILIKQSHWDSISLSQVKIVSFSGVHEFYILFYSFSLCKNI